MLLQTKYNSTRVECVHQHPTGFFMSSDGSTLKFWEKKRGEPRRLRLSYIRSICISPKGDYMAVGGDGIHLLKLGTEEVLNTFPECVTQVVFFAEGKYLAAKTANDELKVWEVSSGKSINPPWTYCSFLCSVGDNLIGNVRIRDNEYAMAFRKTREGWEKDYEFLLDTQATETAISWKNRVLTFTFRGVFRIRDRGEVTQTIHTKTRIDRVTCSPSGNYLAGANLTDTHIWDTRTWRYMGCITQLPFWISCLTFPDEFSLVTGTDNTLITIWDIRELPMFRADIVLCTLLRRKPSFLSHPAVWGRIRCFV